MAIITIPKKRFEREIGKLNKDMQHKIAMFGTPIEDIRKDEFHIEISPNRPDLLSYHGFKRSFLSFLGKKTGMKNYKLNKPGKKYKVYIDSSVRDVRPYTACAIVKGLRLDNEKIKEIIELQEKLHLTIGRKRKKAAIGIYPLEDISLPIKFKALEPDKIKFIPLGMNKELSGLEILQRHPTGIEYSHLLSGKIRFPVFIDSENKILSMPPIINSQSTGKVREKTRDVFIECSGSDFFVLEKCLNIIVTTLAEMGGKIYKTRLKGMKGKTKSITPDFTPEEMEISLEKTQKLLGINLNEKELKKLLEKMGLEYNKGNVKIPAWRVDLLHEVDLIGDVAIAYGYDNFIPEIPKIPGIGKENPKESAKRKIAEILSGLGFLEVSNYHLTNKKEQCENMGMNENSHINLKESKTEYDLLRENLSHKALKVLSENIGSEYPQKIFEIGKIFDSRNGKIHEKESLCMAISPGNFTEIKQSITYLFKMLNLKNLKFKEPEIPEKCFVNGRTAEILSEKLIGSIGEIHPKILQNWKIKMPVALLEIDIEDLLGELVS